MIRLQSFLIATRIERLEFCIFRVGGCVHKKCLTRKNWKIQPCLTLCEYESFVNPRLVSFPLNNTGFFWHSTEFGIKKSKSTLRPLQMLSEKYYCAKQCQWVIQFAWTSDLAANITALFLTNQYSKFEQLRIWLTLILR